MTMNNIKSFDSFVNEAYNNMFQESKTPKEAIDRATTEINHARKLDNPSLVDKITGQLKAWLDSIKYDWKKDPYAMELLSDYVNEGLFDFLKSDVVDFTKDEIPQEKKPRRKLRDIFKSDVEDFSGSATDNTKLKDEARAKERGDRLAAEKKGKATQRPYYGVQEEEEEEQPYKKVVRRRDDYWSDDNVRLREARKRKTTTARK